MKTQMHATLDEAPLRVEAVKIERSEGGAFISLSIRQAGDSIVDGINILMRDSSALRVLVSDLDAACQAIENEEDEERQQEALDAQRSEAALKAAVHAALDRHVQERAETWRAPLRALLSDSEVNDPDFDGWRCSGMDYHLPECGGGCGSLTRPGMDEEGPVGAVPATGGE